MFGVDCGHKFCSDCWKQYLTVKIGDEGAAQAISCPEFKCKIIVDDVTVMELIDDPKIREKYQQLMTSSFVQVRHLVQNLEPVLCIVTKIY